MATKVRTNQPDFDVEFMISGNTPYSFKNDVLRIEVKQTVNEMVNQWKVIMKPKDWAGGVTAYELISPMTYCEISFNKVTGTMTPVIRGFVTSVRKTFDISNGIPQRVVVIEGENYGKVIRMSQIHYCYGFDSMSVISSQATTDPLFAAYNINAADGTQDISQIMEAVFTNLIYPNFQNIQSFTTNRTTSVTTSDPQQAADVPPFTYVPDVAGVTASRLGGAPLTFVNKMAGATEGSVYDFIRTYCNLPWNEVFVEDLPTSSGLTFRPSPYRDSSGNFLATVNPIDFSNSQSCQNIKTIYDNELISYDVSRSDEDVVNYFFTDCIYSPSQGAPFEAWSRATLGTGSNQNQNPSLIAGQIGFDTPNASYVVSNSNSAQLSYSRIELYGLRKRSFPNQYISIQSPLHANGANIMSTPISVSQQLNQLLVKAFDHNSALEEGSILVAGREDIRAGMYVVVNPDRTNTTTKNTIGTIGHFYYVHTLVHVFEPYEGNFTTQLSVSRGEGFLDYNRPNLS
jgi:hypothetical protein